MPDFIKLFTGRVSGTTGEAGAGGEVRVTGPGFLGGGLLGVYPTASLGIESKDGYEKKRATAGIEVAVVNPISAVMLMGQAFSSHPGWVPVFVHSASLEATGGDRGFKPQLSLNTDLYIANGFSVSGGANRIGDEWSGYLGVRYSVIK